MHILLKRVHEPAEQGDGYRVLVDKLWPRGLTEEEAKVDEWLREVGPTVALRKWFNHDEARFEQFKHKYLIELKANHATKKLHDLVAQHEVITLLYGAHDARHNQAVVLKEYLEK